MLGYTSSGYKHALQEVMNNPSLQKQLEQTKCFEQDRALESFLKTLNNNPLQATYGLKHVQYAIKQNAVKNLLLTNHLFRSADNATRKVYHKMTDRIRDDGGDVYLFSDLHPSGERIFRPF